MQWAFWKRRQRDAEFDEEIAHDLATEIDERIRSGMSPEEAARSARRDFGNILLVKETMRDVWVRRSFEILCQDLRYGLRTLRLSRGFAAVSILALALGIGINTAIFTVFDEVAFRPLPLKNGDRIVGIYQTFHGHFDRKMHGNIHMLSYSELRQYQQGNRSFAGIAASAGWNFTLGGAQPEAASGLLVTQNYFRVLGTTIALGREFLPEEFASPIPVVVLSDGFWQRRFGRDSATIGRTIRLNQTLFTVVGITAPGFVGTEPRTPDFWLPLPMQPQLTPAGGPGEPHDLLAAENLGWLDTVGRLKDGVSARQAQTDLSFLAAQLDAANPGRTTEVQVLPSTFLSNPDARLAVWIGGTLVMVAVALVLLIACANVANLLLARATVRQREIALRLSLGASRARLVRQLLTESLLLAVCGGGLGLLLARRALEAGRALLGLPAIDLSPDFNVLAYTLLLTVGASLVFGLLPALQATRSSLSGALKEEGSFLGARVHRSKLRSRLIAFQMAVCTALLIGAGLLVHGLMNLNRLDPGFQAKNLWVASLDLRQQNYDDVRAAAFYREFLSRLAEPGAQSALTALAPWRGVRQVFAMPDNHPEGNPLTANTNVVSSNYFEVMGIRLVRGRTFTPAELHSDPPVAVVSQAMANLWWNGRDAVGQRFRYGSKNAMQSVEVVGVAQDVRSLHVGAIDGPLFYLPANPAQPAGLSVIARTAGPSNFVSTIQKTARDLDPNVLVSVRSIGENLDRETAPMRTGSLSALLLGGLALMLAAIGIYGVMSYAVSQRTREIGIRMALGAQRGNVLQLMLAESMRPVFAGMMLGLLVAIAISVALSKLLLGVSPLDPLAYVAVLSFLSAVALLAGYLPARRALRVDPLTALRYE